MIFHESIVSLTSLYLALAYAIFYLYFEAYPIIFQGMCIFLTDLRSLKYEACTNGMKLQVSME